MLGVISDTSKKIDDRNGLTKGYACVVDAYSSGADYAEIFKAQGFRTVHAQSMHVIPDVYKPSFQPDSFDLLLKASDGYDELVEKLRELGVRLVLAGSEPGTALADKLAADLGLPGNSPRTSTLRRNKFAMGKAVADAGLPSPRQAAVDSVEAARQFAIEGNIWPLVVKPLDSAGSDGVTFCDNVDEVTRAVQTLLNEKNRLDLINREVLVQERLFGQQYIVNGVSRGGRHFISEIWQDNRVAVKGAGLVYDREFLLPREGDLQDRLVEFTHGVLDALGLEEGPSHTELMLTPNGPRLIETGARTQGGILCRAVEEATGESHVTVSAKRFGALEEFEAYAQRGYRLRKQISAVSFIATVTGRLVRTRCDLIKALPSYYSFIREPVPGDEIHRTVDIFTSPAVVYLIHDDFDQLERDYQQIRAWEREGILLEVE